jgi:hypothetical protein
MTVSMMKFLLETSLLFRRRLEEAVTELEKHVVIIEPVGHGHIPDVLKSAFRPVLGNDVQRLRARVAGGLNRQRHSMRRRAAGLADDSRLAHRRPRLGAATVRT